MTAAASASRSGHGSPGNACQTARAARPSCSAATNWAPPLYADQPACRRDRHEPSSTAAGLLLDGGVPGRDRQPQHVGTGARIAGGDRVGEAAHVGGKHRFGGHHLLQPAELADMIGIRTPLEHEGVDEAAVEPHFDADPGLRVVDCSAATR